MDSESNTVSQGPAETTSASPAPPQPGDVLPGVPRVVLWEAVPMVVVVEGLSCLLSMVLGRFVVELSLYVIAGRALKSVEMPLEPEGPDHEEDDKENQCPNEGLYSNASFMFLNLRTCLFGACFLIPGSGDPASRKEAS